MDDQVVLHILELLKTMQEACQELYTSAELENTQEFGQLCADMSLGLRQVLWSVEMAETDGNKKLHPVCESVLDSIRRIKTLYEADRMSCLSKIEFELLPLLQQGYAMYYFFQYLVNHPEHLSEYYTKEKNLLFKNEYIDEALERGSFKYEVSIFVQAYNKLDYTKICVESLLANLPAGLSYELILVNHGSSDGTKEYFESVHPDKQLDIAVNGGGAGAVYRIVEGEFMLMISNDVVVTPHAIENMLACMRSNPKIAAVVPTTPNISNLQTIPAEYSSLGELAEFAFKNNHSDPFRWEQRVRLCNPIQMMRNSLFCSSKGLCISGAFHTSHPVYAMSFPDDRISLLWRRQGYKLMLAKDAYCHHYGSVTLKNEVRQHNEQIYYTEGREEFRKAFGVDPWGTGSCYDPVFMERMVGDHQGHVEVLGINCGLGSNALKIKEQIKEYCHNTDCRLSFLIDDGRYLADLQGVGDQTEKISSIKDFKQVLHTRTFQYVVWEDPFLPQYKFSMLLNCCRKSLTPDGKLLIKQTKQTQKLIRGTSGGKLLGNGWFLFSQEDFEGKV
nr:glycosyltransferase [uncultured Oscillibacter sp.]